MNNKFKSFVCKTFLHKLSQSNYVRMVLGTIHPARKRKERKQSITAPVYAINIFVGMKEKWTHISQSDLESSVRMY